MFLRKNNTGVFAVWVMTVLMLFGAVQECHLACSLAGRCGADPQSRTHQNESCCPRQNTQASHAFCRTIAPERQGNLLDPRPTPCHCPRDCSYCRSGPVASVTSVEICWELDQLDCRFDDVSRVASTADRPKTVDEATRIESPRDVCAVLCRFLI